MAAVVKVGEPVNMFQCDRARRAYSLDRESGIGPFPWGPATDRVFGPRDPFYRDHACPSYADCLGAAAYLNWSHMTCYSCKLGRSPQVLLEMDIEE